MSNDVVIKAEGLGKRYRLGISSSRQDTFRDLIMDGVSSVFRKNEKKRITTETFWALKDASFEIHRGENVGIIGLNGAGKSTLLKILSRITTPTSGMARVTGRLGALLEVGTGFHAELTGRENVFLYGSILGMSKEEIARKFDAIYEFSEIGRFIDTPVKRYSSGMYVRLAFAVAAHLEPEILLLDEVLSVGDLPFQRKCLEFAKGLQQQDATLLFVSHNMFSIKAMCTRVIYLKGGQVQFDGPTEQGLDIYEKECRLSALKWTDERPDEWPLMITDIALSDAQGNAKGVFDYGESMRLNLTYETRRSVETPNFIVAFVRSDGVVCCNYSTETDGIVMDKLDGKGVIELKTPPLKLVAEVYTVQILVREKGFKRLLCAQIGSTFHVRDELFDTHFGVFHESGSWRV